MSMRIAVLGGGVMGETLIDGFLRCVTPTPDIVVAEKRPERAEELASRYGVSIADPAVAVVGADVVVLVVKPQDMGALLDEVGAALEPGCLAVSIAAGVRTSFVEDRARPNVNVVRAMPNTPARIELGVTGISGGARCSPEALRLAQQLLESVGIVIEVPESLQDAVTAVSGSGPAYVFFLAEAMTSAAQELGLDLATATRMVNQTILGAATLLDTSGEPAEVLRRNVTSPNGTTAAAIDALEAQSVGAAIMAAMAAARDRSRALSGD